MKIFCFPYAGGISSLIYSKWKVKMKGKIEIIPVNMPRRNALIAEEGLDSIDEVVDLIIDTMKDDFKGSYAFWGHSMGAIVAYELTLALQMRGFELPRHVFFSGVKPFHLETQRNPIHTYNDEDFIDEIYALNGTRDKTFDNLEFREIFLPILREDFRLVYNYKYYSKKGKLTMPITAMMGSEEKIDELEKNEWHELTRSKVSVYTLPGNHFFIDNNVAEIEAIIYEGLG